MATHNAASAQSFLGPCLVGIFLNIGLYGVAVAQTKAYFVTFRRDAAWIKIYVAVLCLADTLNTVFNATWVYKTLIKNYGDLTAAARLDWLFQSEQSLAGIIATMVQLFYARRIFLLTKQKWIMVVVVISSLISGGCAIGTSIAISFNTSVEGMGTQVVHALIIPWLIACALCDITIATTLTLYLNTCRTGFMRTEIIVNRLVGMVVANGLLTASFTILHLSTFLSLPTGLHMIFNYAVVKLYSNSVLASLNARQEPESFQTDSMKVKDSGRNLIAVQRPSCQPVEVTIREETHEMVDSNPHIKASEWRDLSSAAENLEKLNTECTWV